MSARDTSLAAAAELLAAQLRDWWQSESQITRLLALAHRTVVFGERQGCADLESFGPEVARAFVEASTQDACAPSIDLQHRRRLAIRLLFRAAREAGLTAIDPTLDLSLPPRSQLHTRPLTDGEVALCRASAAWSLSDGRRAPALALAEATGRTVELAQARPQDLDLDRGMVWLHGGATTAPRWGRLSEWGTLQLRRHLLSSGERLIYDGADPVRAGQISVSIALGDVLTRAGLRSEPDVRPASIAAWAGRKVLEETGRIDEAARCLGVSSLDRAARIIDWDWNETQSR